MNYNKNGDKLNIKKKRGCHMNYAKCMEKLRSIKDVAFATVDSKGRVRNRIIDIMIAQGENIYFCTARGKDFYSELMLNKRVAIVGMNKQYQMIRLEGKVKKVENQKYWIDKIFDENPSMCDVYPEKSRYILEAFCIVDGNCEFFDLGVNPIYRASFNQGNEEAMDRKKFYINDNCISCGKCVSICPQQCIKEFIIDQSHCLHCGLCLETCEFKGITRKEV